jgi:cation:H+ antiporter
MLMLTYVLFFVGFFLLIKGADLLVDGAASIAKRFKISDIAIGLTIVAFGTSAPELIVNIFASVQGSNGLAIGNIFGSNIANTFLILGVAAVIYPITVKRGTVYKEIPFSLLAALVLGALLNDVLFDGASLSVLSRSDGFALIGFFVLFLYYTFGMQRVDDTDGVEKIKRRSLLVSLFFIVIGLVGLTVGGKWIVDGAVIIARQFGLSEAFIGLTVVAIGTSLPELATSAVAAFKKNTDIAIGNVVGSNIFNILWILGLSSIINPLEFAEAQNFDLFVVLISTVLLFLFTHTTRPNRIDRRGGIMFLLFYVTYIGFLIYRG